MPPPANQTIGTALYLGNTLPISNVQQQDDGGITYDCWYSFDVPLSLNEVSVFAYGNFGTWNPATTLWRGPIGTPEQIDAGGAVSVPLQGLVTAGERIYVKCIKPSGNVSPAITTVDIIAGPTDAPQNGDIVHPDSSTPYPAVVLGTDATVRSFVGSPAVPFPEVTTSGRIATGEVAVYDFVDKQVKIYAADDYSTPSVTIGNPTLPTNTAGYVIGTNGSTGWWAVKRGLGATHSFAYFINLVGSVTVGPLDMGALSSSLETIAPNLDDSIIYWGETSQQNQPGKAIYQFVVGTLTSSEFLPNGNTGVGPYFWRNVLMLGDGSIVVAQYTEDGTSNHFLTANTLQRYNNAGVLQEQWSLGASNSPSWLFLALDNPTTFWLWTVPGLDGGPAGYLNKYWNFTVGDATIPTPTEIPQFIEGVSQEPGSLSSLRFGTDFGGAPWIFGVPTAPLRLTQLPIEAAYDYRLMSPFRTTQAWDTPPPNPVA